MNEIMPILLDESRLIQETGIEAQVASVIKSPLKALGYSLVRIRLFNLNGLLRLQIMAERADGTMGIEDCKIISRTVSPLLDMEDSIDCKYHLEVSSPGIDRPLVRKSDFANWQGHIVKVKTKAMINNRKKFHGYITNVDNEGFNIKIDRIAYCETMVRIPFINLAEARLILTDKLIRDTLRSKTRSCKNTRLLKMTQKQKYMKEKP
ncbi:MAG: ribosome maturation factor RimP [Candidatus Tokpelaia sp. JSC188]|nr:MAG: ribosome maturation factor RimP [Candidatus Tokpelaia sp. JSC188]